MSQIVGWENKIPELAAFYAILGWRPGGLTPFNLFFVGPPGSNKSEGSLELCKLAGLSAAIVDCSTLDDVSELVGMIDINANRDRSEAKMILGDLTKADVLILDEILNTRKHVIPQLRLLLQGKIVLLANEVPVKWKAIIATGNLTEDMKHGEANLFDSPTADRFIEVVRVPSLSSMNFEQRAAIIENRGGDAFAEAFLEAIKAIRDNKETVDLQWGDRATAYVQSLLSHLAKTDFEFEGRRAKLLRTFVLAAIAYAKYGSNQSRDIKDTVWQVVLSCLRYHELAGVKLDHDKLRQAHTLAAIAFTATGDVYIESRITAELDLVEKIRLVLEHKDRVSSVTKASVFGRVIESGNKPLQLACRILISSTDVLAKEPAALKDTIRRGYVPTENELWSHLPNWNEESALNWPNMTAHDKMKFWASWMSANIEGEPGRLLAATRHILQTWKFDPVELTVSH